MLTFTTGAGVWNPLYWVAILLLALLVAHVLRAMGRKEYKAGTDQAKVFFSGNEVPPAAGQHVRAANVYWGFKTALSRYYNKAIRLHTGNAADYILWFVVCSALVLVAVLVAG